MTSRVIVLDWGFYLHTAIYLINQYTPYTCFNMMIGDLKKIGVNKEDILIIAVDYGRSWRKKVDSEYKSKRKEKREARKEINWKKEYKEMDTLLDKLTISTPFHIVKVNETEADDIMAVCCRYFKDKEIILVTADSDLEQMFYYDNVKIFSPHCKSKKYKISKGNHFKLIYKKIKKEESDDLVSPVVSERDYRRRMRIINLLKLPERIEKEIIEELNKIREKEFDINKIPFKNMKERFMEIYNSENVITYEDSLRKEEKIKQKEKTKRKLQRQTVLEF